jgi:Tfp pilus assembly protein PilF
MFLANIFRAEIYKQEGDSTMAIINYSQAIKLEPEDANIHYRRASLFEEVHLILNL